MPISERISQWSQSVGDWLNEQEWFQEARGKWDELDPQSKGYLKLGLGTAVGLTLLFVLVSSTYNVYKLKRELTAKQDLLQLLQSGSDELRRLREAGTGGAGGGPAGGPWAQHFEAVAANAAVDKAALSVSPEKEAPGAHDTVKETLFDITLKHVNIRQIVRYAFNLENGSRPVKLRNLAIDTNADPAGYMDATLSVSAFAQNQK